LVVEDNKINQKVILAMLRKFQCRPDLAENGQDALDKLAKHPYDLVLMDCQMPVMDGYEAIRILRGQELAGHIVRIPVIALTAHASAGEREKCLSAGMDDYLSKPISRSELTMMLAKWLGDFSPEQTGSFEKMELTEAETPSVCWDEAAALNRLDGDQELLDDMIKLFIEETPARLRALQEALACNDGATLADAAHAIKGMAGHFCADQLLNDAASLEKRAREGESADFPAMAKKVAEETISLSHAFQQRPPTT